MQRTLAAVVFCACVAITLQQGAPVGGPSAPGGSNPDRIRDTPKWTATDGNGEPARRRDDMNPRDQDESYPKRDSGTLVEDSEEDSMQKSDSSKQKPAGSMQKMGGGSMPMMSGSKPAPPPTGIHMKFEFDMGAAAMAGIAGPGRDMGQQGSGGKSGMMGGKSGMMGGKSGMMGGKSGMMGGKSGMMGGKSGMMGGKSGMMGGKMGGKTGGNMGGKMGGKSGGMMAGKGGKMRPHRPILCHVNASGTMVKRECPFNMTCGGGRGIKQGNWTMYFCRKDPAMREVTEFDYPDEGEIYKKSDDEKDEDTSSDAMDGGDDDVTDGGNDEDNGDMGDEANPN